MTIVELVSLIVVTVSWIAATVYRTTFLLKQIQKSEENKRPPVQIADGSYFAAPTSRVADNAGSLRRGGGC